MQQSVFKPTPLGLLPTGTQARIVEIHGGREMIRKLLALGLRVGSDIRVEHHRGRGLVVSSGAARVALGGGIVEKLLVVPLDSGHRSMKDADQPDNTSYRAGRPLTLALAGNPNCGKSALFNALTGIRQTTGNWPGVTVERKEGRFELDGRPVRVFDLPGIYSLDADSLDERVTRDYLLSRDADLIINVLDASNLERNLYLTVQLLEMGVPIVIALNMMDVARKRGVEIDTALLADQLGCPVVPVVAVTKEGVTELNARALAVASGKERGGFPLAQEECVDQAVAELAPALAKQDGDTNARWLALKLLEGDPAVEALIANSDDERLRERAEQWVQHWRKAIAERSGEDTDIHIADTRFGHAHALAGRVMHQRQRAGRTLSDAIDRVVLSRLWGIPLFLAVMYLMFVFTINIGGAFIDFFDGVASALFVDGLGRLLTAMGAPELPRLLLADGIGGGLTVVATFIPIIASLYIFLSALEDSGYMARAAFVMDRFMRSIGLPGKAFVPLIVGFGCNVPAVMATRTLENDRERKLTILMNPFMSCGARLPVYVLFAAAFFPNSGQNVVFALYLTGIHRGAADRAGHEAHAAGGCQHRLYDGTAALPSADPARRAAAHLGPRQPVPARGRARHHRHGAGAEPARRHRHRRQSGFRRQRQLHPCRHQPGGHTAVRTHGHRAG
jgi:ferrous iron transport protein B